jgi:hypothetical protein
MTASCETFLNHLELKIEIDRHRELKETTAYSVPKSLTI